jgi:sugar phosphate isomerase/epimerase
MRVGIGQFSYHRYFGELTRWERSPDVRWNLNDFMQRAASHGVSTVGVQTSYLTPKETERLPELAAFHGLEMILEWGHPVGLDMGRSSQAVQDLRSWMELAHRWSIPLLRIVGGYPTLRGQEPLETQIRRLATILREISLEAMDLGITIAIENHADFTPLELQALIQETGSGNLRALLDFGNCIRLGADLIPSIRSLASLIVAVHLRDLVVLPQSIGNPQAFWPTAPLGHGSLDIAGALQELYRSGFQGCLLLELTNLHANWAEQEDEVINQSLMWLRRWWQAEGRIL